MLTSGQYCAEEGENCTLKAAVVCSNPFNLEISSKMTQSTLIGKEVYLRVMGCKWFCAMSAVDGC